MEVEEPATPEQKMKALECSIYIHKADQTIAFTGNLLKYFPNFLKAFLNKNGMHVFGDSQEERYILGVPIWRTIFLELSIHDILLATESEKGPLMPLDGRIFFGALGHINLLSEWFKLAELIRFYNIPLILDLVAGRITKLYMAHATSIEWLLENHPSVAPETLQDGTIQRKTFYHTFHLLAKEYNILIQRIIVALEASTKIYSLKKLIEISFLPLTQSVISGGNHFTVVIGSDAIYVTGRNTCGQQGEDPATGSYFMVTDDPPPNNNNNEGDGPRGILKKRKPIIPENDNYQHMAYHPLPNRENLIVCSVWCGLESTLLLTSQGLYACGNNAYNCLGMPVDQATNQFPRMVTSLQRCTVEGVHAVSCGLNDTLFLTRYGLYVAGQNDHGQLGTGDNSPVYKPRRVETGSNRKIVSVAMGGTFSIILLEGGSVRMSGMMRVIREKASNHYVELDLPVNNNAEIVAISASSSHVMLLSEDGRVYTMGSNTSGELGHGNTDPYKEPELVRSLARYRIVSVHAGIHCSFFVNHEGRVFACGNNTKSRLGTVSLHDTSVPTVVDRVTEVVSIASTRDSTTFLCCRGLYIAGKTGESSSNDVPMNSTHMRHILSDEASLCIDYSEQTKHRKLKERDAAKVLLSCHLCGCTDTALLGKHIPTGRIVCLNECVNK